VCPFTIDRPVMRQRWQRLTFLHWQFESAAVQRLLPDGLQADLHDGTAWVGLVPFFMHVAMPGGREFAWVSRFCETNVRTYVRDSAGRAGIWFFSLDAARLSAVVVARTTYGLPYRGPMLISAALAARRGQRGRDQHRPPVRRRRGQRARSLPNRPVDPVQRLRQQIPAGPGLS